MKELYKALLKFQGLMKPVAKDANNPHFDNDYASLAAIVKAATPHLQACGLAFTQVPVEDGRLRTTIFHVESGECVESTMELNATRKDPQGIGSAMTYAKRQALTAMLGIVSEDEDDDGEAAVGRTAPVAAKAAPVARGELLTDAQRTKIWAMAGERGFTTDAMNARAMESYGVRVSSLTKEQAAEVIEKMSQK